MISVHHRFYQTVVICLVLPVRWSPDNYQMPVRCPTRYLLTPTGHLSHKYHKHTRYVPYAHQTYTVWTIYTSDVHQTYTRHPSDIWYTRALPLSRGSSQWSDYAVTVSSIVSKYNEIWRLTSQSVYTKFVGHGGQVRRKWKMSGEGLLLNSIKCPAKRSKCPAKLKKTLCTLSQWHFLVAMVINWLPWQHVGFSDNANLLSGVITLSLYPSLSQNTKFDNWCLSDIFWLPC